MIFEQSGTGEVLAGWKPVNLVLVFKKGEKEDLRNNSPASLISVIG